MSRACDVAAKAYELAKAGQHGALRELIADHATWEPSRKAKWKACSDAEQIVKTLAYRTSRSNRLRPGESLDLGNRTVIRIKGKRLERLGARGFLVPKLYQVVEIENGKIVRMADYSRHTEALAAAGLDA